MTVATTQPPANVEFTSHNVRLADGTYTKPDEEYAIDANPWFLSAKGVLTTLFPENRQLVRVADLRCLEGGYALEFARLGSSSVFVHHHAEVCVFVKRFLSSVLRQAFAARIDHSPDGGSPPSVQRG